jgi:hypothetical protein
VRDGLKTLDALANLCLNPGPDSVRHLAEIVADSQIRTCVVFNGYSHSQFHWDESTKKWISQEGPTGPCGFMNIDALEHDKTYNTFWIFTERKIKTNQNSKFPSDELLGAHSCSEFAETTFNYTWKVQDKVMKRTHIKHM